MRENWRYALRCPSRLVALALAVASLALIWAHNGRTFDYGPGSVVNVLGGFAILWIIGFWNRFWGGAAVRRERARSEGGMMSGRVKKPCPCGCGRAIGRFDTEAARYWILSDSGVELVDRVVETSEARPSSDPDDLTRARNSREAVEELRYALEGWLHHEDRGLSTPAIAKQAKRLKLYVEEVAGSFALVDAEWVRGWTERTRERAKAWEEATVLT